MDQKRINLLKRMKRERGGSWHSVHYLSLRKISRPHLGIGPHDGRGRKAAATSAGQPRRGGQSCRRAAATQVAARASEGDPMAEIDKLKREAGLMLRGARDILIRISHLEHRIARSVPTSRV